MNETQTILLYLSIIIITFFLACMTQTRKIYIIGADLKVFKPIPFCLSFLIPWFFFAFAGMSNDYAEYIHIFNTVTWQNFYSIWIEPGYAFLNLLIKTIVNDPVVAIVIIKTILMGIVYKVIYDYRNKVSIGLAVLGYLCFAYLDAFCMLRINLAASLLLLAIDLYDNKKRTVLSLITIAIAFMIHYSVSIFIIVVIAYVICVRRDRISPFLLLILFISLIVTRFMALPLLEIVTTTLPFLTKYSIKYSQITSSGTGIMQFVLHAPFVLVFANVWEKILRSDEEDHKLLLVGLIITPFSLFFGTMGYTFEVIGRSFVFFIYLWIIVLPRYYSIIRAKKGQNWLIIGFLIILWDFAKLYFYIEDGSLISSGIAEYRFIWE